MSKELRWTLIQVLTDPDHCKDVVNLIEVDEVLSSPSNQCVPCRAYPTIFNKDLRVGSTTSNRTLYVTGMIDDKRINQILLDWGSAVNLLPLRVLRVIRIAANQLSPNLLTMYGFS